MKSENVPPTIQEYLSQPAHDLRTTGGRRIVGAQNQNPSLPLVTILTIVRNCKDLLPQAIRSVLDQSYSNIEYLIIDGASTDGTLEIIKQFEDKIDLWISEPDRGTSDATNKAISRAHGEFVFWLCADDWIEENYISLAVDALRRTGADFVFGNTNYYEGNTFQFTQIGDANYARSINYQMPRINSPSMVIRGDCFNKIGLIDLRYKAASDYEWILRLHVIGGVGSYDPKLNVCHRLGGISSKQSTEAIAEVRLASIRHGFSPIGATGAFIYHFFRRKLRQLAQIILPKSAYRSILRWVRSGYSAS